ncbi:reverse transcriptase domain-containing protein, partial [Tanacetum coccineum]
KRLTFSQGLRNAHHTQTLDLADIYERRKTLEEDLAVPWSCEDVDPFTPRIHNFRSSRKTRMPNNVKTYDRTGDPEDHLKGPRGYGLMNYLRKALIVTSRGGKMGGPGRHGHRAKQATGKTVTGQNSHRAKRATGKMGSGQNGQGQNGQGYKDLKAAFLTYFMQQKKHVKGPVEIHNIKQRNGETIKEFMERFKVETGRMKGPPECMKISRFMHGVNNLELMKRLNERVPKTLEEMMTTTMAFIRGETVAVSKKKVHTPWKPQDQSKRHTSKRRSDFRNQPRDGRGSNKFTPLNSKPKEIFVA